MNGLTVRLLGLEKNDVFLYVGVETSWEMNFVFNFNVQIHVIGFFQSFFITTLKDYKLL